MSGSSAETPLYQEELDEPASPSICRKLATHAATTLNQLSAIAVMLRDRAMLPPSLTSSGNTTGGIDVAVSVDHTRSAEGPTSNILPPASQRPSALQSEVVQPARPAAGPLLIEMCSAVGPSSSSTGAVAASGDFRSGPRSSFSAIHGLFPSARPADDPPAAKPAADEPAAEDQPADTAGKADGLDVGTGLASCKAESTANPAPAVATIPEPAALPQPRSILVHATKENRSQNGSTEPINGVTVHATEPGRKTVNFGWRYSRELDSDEVFHVRRITEAEDDKEKEKLQLWLDECEMCKTDSKEEAPVAPDSEDGISVRRRDRSCSLGAPEDLDCQSPLSDGDPDLSLASGRPRRGRADSTLDALDNQDCAGDDFDLQLASAGPRRGRADSTFDDLKDCDLDDSALCSDPIQCSGPRRGRADSTFQNLDYQQECDRDDFDLSLASRGPRRERAASMFAEFENELDAPALCAASREILRVPADSPLQESGCQPDLAGDGDFSSGSTGPLRGRAHSTVELSD